MTNELIPHGRIYEFGLKDRLKIAREQAGYDQQDFERVTGISRASISNYERGKFVPRRPNILAWALATGFDAGWLETGNAPRPNGPEGEKWYTARDSNPEPIDFVKLLASRQTRQLIAAA